MLERHWIIFLLLVIHCSTSIKLALSFMLVGKPANAMLSEFFFIQPIFFSCNSKFRKLNLFKFFLLSISLYFFLVAVWIFSSILWIHASFGIIVDVQIALNTYQTVNRIRSLWNKFVESFLYKWEIFIICFFARAHKTTTTSINVHTEFSNTVSLKSVFDLGFICHFLSKSDSNNKGNTVY